jgi:hypothetical protein
MRGDTAAEIHRHLVSVYCEDVMNRQNVPEWCCEFEAEEGKLIKTFVLTDV